MARRRLYIHAGAHRTGTSSFQQCLHVNQVALADAGYQVAFPARDGASSGTLGLRLPAPRHGAGATRRFAPRVAEVLAEYDPSQPLILSEENIPGRMIHFLAGRFYPAAEARLRALRAGLGDAAVGALLFVIRSYDELYVSGHRKRAEDKLADPFSASIPNLMAMDRGWPEIVALLRDILRPGELVVVPYEVRGRSVDLLGRLAPDLEIARLEEPQDTVNLSATDAALLELQRRYANGEELSGTARAAIVRNHAGDTTSRAFAEFSDTQATGLQARYRTDLARIAAMPGVHLLDPGRTETG